MSEQAERTELTEDEKEQIRRGLRRLLLRLAVLAGGIALIALLARYTNQHEWAVGWLRRYETRDPWTFCWRIALEANLAALALGIVTILLLYMFRYMFRKEKLKSSDKKSEKRGLEKKIIQPAVRTLAHQAAPIYLFSLAGAGVGTQVAAAAFLHMLVRTKRGDWAFAPMHFISGVYYSFAFAFWFQSSFWTAFWVTAVSRALLPVAVHFMKPIGRFAAYMLKKWAWILAAGCIGLVGVMEGSDSFAWLFDWVLGRYQKHGPWAFCWRISLEGKVASIAFLIVVSVAAWAFNADWTRNKKRPKITRADLLLRAPLLETLLFQTVPIGILNALDASFGTQAVVSAFLFAAAHFTNSTMSGVAAGIPGGFYLAFTYAFWLQDSFVSAFWITALSHSLQNLPGALLIGVKTIAVPRRVEFLNRRRYDAGIDDNGMKRRRRCRKSRCA